MTAPPRQPCHVLVAEDEASIITSLEFLLQAAGYQASVARDGRAALELARTLRPGLVILDVMLPLVDGYEVCRQLRSDESCRGMRILMLTARGRQSDRGTGLAAGADDYMTKPFSTRELMEKVGRLLAPPPLSD